MATYRKSNGSKSWHARRKRDGVEFHLGYFATKLEAEAAEEMFDYNTPSRRGAVNQVFWRNQYGWGYYE